MQHQSEPKSRIAKDLSSWERIEGKLVDRYGKRILYDRDFLKAKRDIYSHISNKYKRYPLNLYEKAEMKVLRGQQRQMLRQLYPNALVRLTRNVLVFTGNLVLLIPRTGLATLKSIFSVNATANTTYIARRPYSTPLRNNQQQNVDTDRQSVLRPIPAQKKINGQSQTITRKLPVKSRTQMPARKPKGVQL